MTDNNDDSVFNNIMSEIGDHGPFQKRFNYMFNLVLVILVSMPYMNIVISLSIPEHWCKVPGIELTNYTIEEWKTMTIPVENNTMGRSAFSNCKMYNSSKNFLNLTEDVIDCQHGWEYNTTWYKKTAPSQQNWVCERELYVTNAFVFGRIGDVLGMFIFGQLGDLFGRRPVFFISLITLIVGRTALSFTSSIYWLFLASTLVGSLTSTSVFLSPLIIGMEISRDEDRAYIAMLQNVGWVLGFGIMPFMMWILGDWIQFMLITTLPCTIYLFSSKFIIESPRWLVSKGKLNRCVQELNKIAKTNGTKLPEDILLILKKTHGKVEKVHGVFGLFSSWRLAKNTVLLIIAWIITSLIYYILTLNVNNLGGNPFLNYFYQTLAEVPAYVVGKYSTDYFGRRFTNIGAFLSTCLGCIPLIYVISDPSYQFYTAAIAAFLKFTLSITFYAINLQSLETYPTCLRQTGTSVGGICASAFGILGPYIVYLGTSVDARYPYIISACLCIIGAICGLFLPETLYQKLPETLAEAQVFGAKQKFWSLPKKDGCEPMPIKA